MVSLRWSFTQKNVPSEDATFTFSWKKNGQTFETGSKTCGVASTTQLNQPDVKTLMELKITKTASCAGALESILRVSDSGGSTIVEKLLTVPFSTQNISFSQTLMYLGGSPNGPPSYLEELHKLDNFSKPQYIPSGLQKAFI